MKKILYGIKAKAKILRGIEKLARAVRVTLGGEGRNVIFGQQYGAPDTTRDGVTVAREFDLEDEFEKLGSDLLKVAALKTNENVGDGTTTAIILAESIVKEGFKEIELGSSPIKIVRELRTKCGDIIKKLSENAQQITTKKQMAQIGTIASRDSEIGALVADVVHEAGKDGTIDVQDSKGIETTKEVVKGLKLEKGWISPYFINNPEKMIAEYHDINVLITDQKISDYEDIEPIFTKNGKRGMVVVADDVEGNALSYLIMNHLRQMFRSLAVKAPGFGDNKRDILNDLAVITGGTFISGDTGINLRDVTPDMLGKAERVIVGKSNTIIAGGAGTKKAVEDRVKQLKSELLLAENKYDKDNLTKRLAGLLGGVAVIKVGAASEVEQKERKYLVEDAVSAVSAARDEGVIEGGGLPLLKIAQELGTDTPVNRILKKALSAPFIQIIENGGENANEIMSKVINSDFKEGYDVSNRKYGNMFEMGIIDPVKVTRTALENAMSVASMVLTTETIIAIKEKEKDVVMAPPQM